jgi:hypothetical protein
LTSNLKTSKRDTCLKTTTWFPSRGTTRKRKCRTLYFFRRRKRPNKLKWLRNKTSRGRDRTYSELSRKTKWRIKLAFNPRGLLKWKLKKRNDENFNWPKEITFQNATRRKIWDKWKWTRLRRWRN